MYQNLWIQFGVDRIEKRFDGIDNEADYDPNASLRSTNLGLGANGLAVNNCSAVMLSDHDGESRGLRFSRFADDCNIYVKSQRAGERVVQRVTKWLDRKLRLKVNQSKSAVDRPWKRKFLGFTFTTRRKRSIAQASRAKFKKRVREITKRNRGSSLRRVIGELRSCLVCWRGYFGFCQTPSVLRGLDSLIHRRLRSYTWKQWKTGKRRFK